jgi:ATP-dependent DNA ligase
LEGETVTWKSLWVTKLKRRNKTSRTKSKRSRLPFFIRAIWNCQLRARLHSHFAFSRNAARSGKTIKQLFRNRKVWKSKPRAETNPSTAKIRKNFARDGDWIYEIKFDGFRALAFKNGATSPDILHDAMDK